MFFTDMLKIGASGYATIHGIKINRKPQRLGIVAVPLLCWAVSNLDTEIYCAESRTFARYSYIVPTTNVHNSPGQ